MAKRKLSGTNYNAIRDHLFDRIHKGGHDLKNDFPNILRSAIAAKAWTHFADAEGKPFENLVDWMAYSFPNGLSMGQGQHAITYEEALKLTEGAADVHEALAKNAPSKGHGGDRRSKSAKQDQVSSTKLEINRGGGSKTALAVRLAEKKPKFYERYLRGEFKTITAAALASGMIKDDTNLRRAKSAYRLMSDDDRADFLRWMKTDDAKPDGKK